MSACNIWASKLQRYARKIVVAQQCMAHVPGGVVHCYIPTSSMCKWRGLPKPPGIIFIYCMWSRLVDANDSDMCRRMHGVRSSQTSRFWRAIGMISDSHVLVCVHPCHISISEIDPSVHVHALFVDHKSMSPHCVVFHVHHFGILKI